MKKEMRQKTLLIYNPHAGGKRNMLPMQRRVTLEDIRERLEQYQIPVDLAPTKGPGHATILAKQSIKKGYTMVIAAGGDGTVGEVANGLIHSSVVLGILPLGSYMNVAKMLSLPLELEQAVVMIKIGRKRKIDAGALLKLEGEKLEQPYYFLEEAGIGLEAQIHYYLTGIFERKKYSDIVRIIKTISLFYAHKVTILLDAEKIETRSPMLTISNGPLGGASLPLAPKAKLNDHRFTVRLYKMSKRQLTFYLLHLLLRGHASSKNIFTFQATQVKVSSKGRYMVHADAREFGTTPVTFKLVPNALTVITGFPKPGTGALEKRTYLDVS